MSFVFPLVSYHLHLLFSTQCIHDEYMVHNMVVACYCLFRVTDLFHLYFTENLICCQRFVDQCWSTERFFIWSKSQCRSQRDRKCEAKQLRVGQLHGTSPQSSVIFRSSLFELYELLLWNMYIAYLFFGEWVLY